MIRMTLTLTTQWEARLKLRAEGDKLRAVAILEAFGNITREWLWLPEKNDYRCILENGEVYEP